MNEDLFLEKVCEEQYRQANERGYAKFKYAPGEKGYGPEACDECGTEIPEVRRQYGYCLCVQCAEAEERSRRR